MEDQPACTGAASFGARDTDFPIDHAKMLVSFVQPVPRDFFSLLSWTNLRMCLPPSVSPPLALMGCHVVCTAPQEALAPSSLRCQPGRAVEQFSFQKLANLTPRDGLFARLNPHLTLCNCDCKILTAAMCSGSRRYSIECNHPSQRCVSQRVMTSLRSKLRPLPCAPSVRKTWHLTH